MIFWILVAVFIIAITFIVLLFAHFHNKYGQMRVSLNTQDADIGIYNNQLTEIDYDLKRGLIDLESAQEARLELARNILASQKKQSQNHNSDVSTKANKKAFGVGVLLIPCIIFAVYSFLGSPETASQPFSAFMAKNPATLSKEEQLIRNEVLFNRHPNDGKLADELSSDYLIAGRFQDAANTYLDALRLNGETAPRLVGYGLSLTGYENGIITSDAQKAFEKAAKLSPNDFYPRLFIADALKQAGQFGVAADGLQKFSDTASQNQPWQPKVKALIKQLRQLETTQSQPKTAPTLQPSPKDEDKTAMIASMVDSLSDRLTKNPDDLDGWKMLIHSRLVLKQMELAQQALKLGRQKLTVEKADALVKYAQEQGLVVDKELGRDKQ